MLVHCVLPLFIMAHDAQHLDQSRLLCNVCVHTLHSLHGLVTASSFSEKSGTSMNSLQNPAVNMEHISCKHLRSS